MIDEQEEYMIENNSKTVPVGDEHICSETDACSVDLSQTPIASPETTPVVRTKPVINITPKTILFGAVAVFVLVIGGLSGFVYTHAASNKTVRAITIRLPFPAFLVGRNVITYAQYYKESDSLKKYFASLNAQGQELPTDDQLRTMVQQTLVNKTIVKKLASDYGIAVEPKKVQEYYQSFLQASQGASEDAVIKQLHDTFGWTPAQFKKNIVEPVVLSAEVGDYIAKSPFFQKPLRDEIDRAHKRVTTGGEDFETVGNEVHQKVQIDLKSDLGFIKTSDLPSTWADKVVNLESGKVTDVVELPQGYAIFKVSERIKSQNTPGKKADSKISANDQIHLLTITVPKKTLDQVAGAYLKSVSVKTLIKE